MRVTRQSNWSTTVFVGLIIMGCTAAVVTFGPEKVERARQIRDVKKAVQIHRRAVRKGQPATAWKDTTPHFQRQTSFTQFESFTKQLYLFYFDSDDVTGTYESYDIRPTKAVYRETVDTARTKAMFVVTLTRTDAAATWKIEEIHGHFLDLTVLE